MPWLVDALAGGLAVALPAVENCNGGIPRGRARQDDRAETPVLS